MSVKHILGLFVVLGAGAAFAEHHEAVTTTAAVAAGGSKVWLAVAAAFGMSIATVGGALGQSRALSAALEGIARNPGAQTKVMIPMIIGLALIESLVLFSFLVANGIAGKI